MNALFWIRQQYNFLSAFITEWMEPVGLLLLRLLPAKVFLDSGMTKWNGWFQFDEQKYDLFLYEYFCPDPVRKGALLLCDPETLEYTEGSLMVPFVETLALLAGVIEIALPILLVVGLFSRFAAFGLLCMTLFIQFAVFPSSSHWWNPAAWWFVALFMVFAKGPGKLSLDYLMKLEKYT